MASGLFCFAACDVLAKVLTADLPAFQIVWFRQLGLLAGVVVLLSIKGLTLLKTPRPMLQIGRGITAALSATGFIIGVRYVPLADAVAVTFVAPFIVTLLGALILREPVGPRRWAAVAVGFVGMLIVIRPGMGVLHPAILFIFLAACSFSLRQILSRYLSGVDSILTTVVYTSVTSSLLLSLTLPFVWQTPDTLRLWVIIVGMAICAGLGEVLVIRALDIGQAVAVAPMQYTMILWGTFYGFVVFGDLPDGWTILGCTIIIASGLYTLHRERLKQGDT